MGKMTISGKDSLTKDVPNDDTDIWKAGHHLHMAGCFLFSKDPPPDIEDRGTLDGENYQSGWTKILFYKPKSKVLRPLFSKSNPILTSIN